MNLLWYGRATHFREDAMKWFASSVFFPILTIFFVHAGCSSDSTFSPGTDGGNIPVQDGAVSVSDGEFYPAKDVVEPNWDAFFATDPPPQYCGPDGGGTTPPLPGGTPDCPD